MKKKKIVAVLLGIVCSMSLLACGNAEGDVVGGNVSDGNVLVTEDSVASDMSTEPVVETDVAASEEEKLFDTSAFDPTLFDGKWVIDDVEVTLPLGSVRDTQALGVDIVAFGIDAVVGSDASENELIVNADVYETMIEPDRKSYIQSICLGSFSEAAEGKTVVFDLISLPDFMDIYAYGDVEFMNDSESEIELLDAEIEWFFIDVTNDNLASKLGDILGMECDTLDAFNMEAVVQRFGQPIYYNEYESIYDTDGLRLFYYYGDYSLFFGFEKDSENQYVFQGVCYVTQSYMEADARVFDFYTEYLEVCEEYK